MSVFKQIMVSYDGTPFSHQAVQKAVDLAHLCNAELTIATVVPSYVPVIFDGYNYTNDPDREKVEQTWIQEAHAAIDRLIKTLHITNLKIHPKVIKSDDVAHGLLKLAIKSHVDLMVMASHGRGPFQRLILGSETHKVLTHTKIPVLVMR